MGASSSRRLGWLRKISFEETQSCLISDSVSCTCFVVRPTFAPVSRRIISSSTASSINNFQPKKNKKKKPNSLFLSFSFFFFFFGITERKAIRTNYGQKDPILTAEQLFVKAKAIERERERERKREQYQKERTLNRTAKKI